MSQAEQSLSDAKLTYFQHYMTLFSLYSTPALWLLPQDKQKRGSVTLEVTIKEQILETMSWAELQDDFQDFPGGYPVCGPLHLNECRICDYDEMSSL